MKLEKNCCDFFAQEIEKPISSDVIEKYNKLMNSSAVKKETFDLYKEIADSLSGNDEQIKIDDEIGYANGCFFGVDFGTDYKELNEHYNEIYNRDTSEFEFNLDDYARSRELADNFEYAKWHKLSSFEKVKLIKDYYNTLSEELELEDTPILLFGIAQPNLWGYFDDSKNKIFINLANIGNPSQISNTIAHELWHAHQYEVAKSGDSYISKLYSLNFDNYITPEMDFWDYQDQLLEAEARAFAEHIVEREEA